MNIRRMILVIVAAAIFGYVVSILIEWHQNVETDLYGATKKTDAPSSGNLPVIPREQLLKVEKLSPKPNPFILTGVQEGEKGQTFTIARRDGRKTYFVRMDEMLMDPQYVGYKVVLFDRKIVERPDATIKDSAGNPRMTKQDISELMLQKEDGTSMQLVKGAQTFGTDLLARLYFITEKRSFIVAPTSTFKLEGVDYKVLRVEKNAAGKPQVLIQKVENKSMYTITALKPEDLLPTPSPVPPH